MPLLETAEALADEGQYFTANNAQTGVAMTAAAGFAATTPFFLIQNNDAAGGKRIYLDYAALITTAAGSAASGLTTIQAAVYVDDIPRYSSGGTQLTPKCVNMAQSPTSIAKVYAGAITALAADAARAVVGLRVLRPCVSATVADVVGETKVMTFGGVWGFSGNVVAANPNVIPVPMPPVIIGPGHSALIHVFYAAAGTPVAASYAPELGWYERNP